MADNEIQKADVALRTKTIWLVSAIFIVCLIANRALSGYLDSAGENIALLTERLRHAVYVLAIAALPVVYFSFYLWRMARRIIIESRFPPIGMPVIRDTAIKTGVSARRKGYALAAFSILIGIVFITLPIILFLLLDAIVDSA